MGGLASVMPWLMGAFLFIALRLASALPGLNGFVGEFLVIVGTFAVNHWFAVVAAIARRPRRDLPAVVVPADGVRAGPRGAPPLPDVSLREVVVLVPVLALLLVFGVFPKLLTDRIEPATDGA